MNAEARASVLDMIKVDALNWTARGRAGTAYRYFDNESPGGYRPLTPAERKELLAMIAEGIVTLHPGWRPYKGLVQLAQPNLLTH